MNKRLGAALAILCVALACLNGCSGQADPPQSDKQSSDSKKSSDKKSDSKKDTAKKDTNKEKSGDKNADKQDANGGTGVSTGNDTVSDVGVNVGDAVPAETISQWINGEWCYYHDIEEHCITVNYPIADTRTTSLEYENSTTFNQWHLDALILQDTGCYRGEMQPTEPHFPGNARGGWLYCPAGAVLDIPVTSPEYEHPSLDRLYIPGFGLRAAYRVD